MNSFVKKLVSGIAALTMCLSVAPISINAVVDDNSTSLVSNQESDLLSQVMALGLSEEEAQVIVDNVDAEEILTILYGNGEDSTIVRSSSTTTHSLLNSTYSNVSSWNTDDSCSSVAAAILLVYQSCYNDPEISYSSPYNLYLALKPYIETYTRVSTISALATGLTDYLEDAGTPYYVKSLAYESDNASVYMKKMVLLAAARLNRDEPIIAAGLYNSASSSLHAVVVEKMVVTMDSDGAVDTSASYFYVNDGYGNTNQKRSFASFIVNSGCGIVYFF
ncbi:MAG: hypothetical protein LUG94_05805 [Ruminococcus sp.]|nr:hypothetical protein [Ruminococcus sp.]